MVVLPKDPDLVDILRWLRTVSTSALSLAAKLKMPTKRRSRDIVPNDGRLDCSNPNPCSFISKRGPLNKPASKQALALATLC
jgi:hypothetical protein